MEGFDVFHRFLETEALFVRINVCLFLFFIILINANSTLRASGFFSWYRDHFEPDL